MELPASRAEGARTRIAGGRIVVGALACWCLGWMLGLFSLVADGALADGLSVVARFLLWSSFGCVIVAIVVRLARGGRGKPDESE